MIPCECGPFKVLTWVQSKGKCRVFKWNKSSLLAVDMKHWYVHFVSPSISAEQPNEYPLYSANHNWCSNSLIRLLYTYNPGQMRLKLPQLGCQVSWRGESSSIFYEFRYIGSMTFIYNNFHSASAELGDTEASRDFRPAPAWIVCRLTD